VGRAARLRIVRKSVAYLTRGPRVLFFRTVELPDAGAELPGGTLEAGEDPEAGLLRELLEETGFDAFGPHRLLGVVHHVPHDIEGEVHERHFYHLTLEGEAAESWERTVVEGNGVFTFSFFWVDRSSVPDHIYPGHDVFLADVFRDITAAGSGRTAR
jgi:8-oxo-dGTP pyrophosphatase MutT (NUDIX family)